MNIHEVVDGLEGWIRSRQAQAPVESEPADLDRFVDVDPASVHPDVEPASLSYGPPSADRSLLDRLPPSRAPRTTRSLAFRSPVDTGHGANDRVTGVRWNGEGQDSARAAVIMLHGAFAPSFAAERLLSVPLLRRPVHVFAVAAPYHMERAPASSEYSGQYLLSGDVPRFVEGMVQAVADVRSLVASLRESGYESVYLSGISQGGNIAAQAVTMADVDGAILAIPAVDMAETLERAPIARGVRRAGRRAGFDEARVRDALAPITPIELGPPVPDPSAIQFTYGQWDRQAPPGPIEALLEAWDGAAATRYPAGHRTMGLRILALRHQLAGWLDAKLAAD